MTKVKSLPRTLHSPSHTLAKSSSSLALHEAFSQTLISRIRGVSRRNLEPSLPAEGAPKLGTLAKVGRARRVCEK